MGRAAIFGAILTCLGVGALAQAPDHPGLPGQVAMAEGYLDSLEEHAPEDYARLLAKLKGRRPAEVEPQWLERPLLEILRSRAELANYAMTAPDALAAEAITAQAAISSSHAAEPQVCRLGLFLGGLALPPEALGREMPKLVEAQDKLVLALLAGRDHPEPAVDWTPAEGDSLRTVLLRSVEVFGLDPAHAEATGRIRDRHADCDDWLAYLDWVTASDADEARIMRGLFLATLAVRGSLFAFMIR